MQRVKGCERYREYESSRGARVVSGARGVRGVRDVRVARGANHLVKRSLPDFFCYLLLSRSNII